jgi:hypothetical protein
VLTWPGTLGPNHSKNVDDWGLRRFFAKAPQLFDGGCLGGLQVSNSQLVRFALGILETTAAAREGRGRSILGTKCLAASKSKSSCFQGES